MRRWRGGCRSRWGLQAAAGDALLCTACCSDIAKVLAACWACFTAAANLRCTRPTNETMQEEREFQQRLLALAGIGPAAPSGAPGEDGADGEEAEYASEDEVDPDDLSYEEVGAVRVLLAPGPPMLLFSAICR